MRIWFAQPLCRHPRQSISRLKFVRYFYRFFILRAPDMTLYGQTKCHDPVILTTCLRLGLTFLIDNECPHFIECPPVGYPCCHIPDCFSDSVNQDGSCNRIGIPAPSWLTESLKQSGI